MGQFLRVLHLVATNASQGEVVFTTGMTGYQETIIGSGILWTNRDIYLSFNRELWN